MHFYPLKASIIWLNSTLKGLTQSVKPLNIEFSLQYGIYFYMWNLLFHSTFSKSRQLRCENRASKLHLLPVQYCKFAFLNIKIVKRADAPTALSRRCISPFSPIIPFVLFTFRIVFSFNCSLSFSPLSSVLPSQK